MVRKAMPITNQLLGAILAEPLYDTDSRLLLKQGAALTDSAIANLRKRGLDSIAVEAAEAEAVQVKAEAVQVEAEAVQVETEAVQVEALAAHQSASVGGNAQICDGCGSHIDLEVPNATDRPAKSWVCTGCGGVYFGANPSPRSLLLPIDVILEPLEKIALPPSSERAFNESRKQTEAGSEKRKHKRLVASIPATVVPLNRNLKIVGTAIEVMTSGISLGGVSLKHMSQFKYPNIYVAFPLSETRKIQAIAKIVRCRNREGAFEIGCQLISRVASHNLKPKCSVGICEAVAVCEVFQVNMHLPEGDIFFDRDDTCPYLCKRHAVENESFSEGDRRPRGFTYYPHTNKNHLQGYSVYKPLLTRP